MLYTIGRRKNAIASVTIYEGNGSIFVNNIDLKEYMQYNPFCISLINKPFSLLSLEGKYKTIIKTSGGGLVCQAEASMLAIARALIKLNPSYRSLLKSKGYLTQNSREKERRKYGLKKARKAPQYSKR